MIGYLGKVRNISVYLLTHQSRAFDITSTTSWSGKIELAVMNRGMKPSLKSMEDVSSESTSTEYYGWCLVLDFTVWDYWAWNDGDLFDSGHCVSLPFSWIGPDFFYRGLFWGQGFGVHYKECWASRVQYCWATDCTEVIVFVWTVTADIFCFWLPNWFGY